MEDHSQRVLIYTRASIHLPGLPLGSEAFVDSSDPYIADALDRGYLVAVVETTPEPVPDPEPPSETGKEEE